LRSLAEALKVEATIAIRDEACGAVVAALDYVKRNASEFKSRSPSHPSV
jgi:hypothetical protein